AMRSHPVTLMETSAAKSSTYWLVERNTPSGMPISEPMMAATATICRVWPVARTMSQAISGDIAEHLRGEVEAAEDRAHALKPCVVGGEGNEQRAERLAGDLVDGAAEDVEVDAKLAGQPRQHRVGRMRAGEDDAQHHLRAWLALLGEVRLRIARQLHARHAGKQHLGRRVLWVGEDVEGRTALDDLAAV